MLRRTLMSADACPLTVSVSIFLQYDLACLNCTPHVAAEDVCERNVL